MPLSTLDNILSGYMVTVQRFIQEKNIGTPVSNVHFGPKKKSNHKTCFKYKINFSRA